MKQSRVTLLGHHSSASKAVLTTRTCTTHSLTLTRGINYWVKGLRICHACAVPAGTNSGPGGMRGIPRAVAGGTAGGIVWWPSVSSCARILFREAGIAIPRIRDIFREFGKFSESPGFFPRVREVFRESRKFSESPGSFPRVRVASARIRKTCQTDCARMVGSAAQWGVSSSTWLMRNGL